MAIKNELLFGFNDFGKQSKLSITDTIAQMLLNILLLRPGQIPSRPELGIDVKKYLYAFDSDVDTNTIKNALATQCSTLLPYINFDNMQILLVPYDVGDILYILFPLNVSTEEIERGTLMVGFKKEKKSNIVTFNYKVTDEQIV